jgi:hypothetical protein
MPRVLTRSFAGGEITPEAYNRLDLAKHQTGLALARNFWILPHGPAQNRPGFGYVNHAKYAAKRHRLIEFNFNTEQTYVLEFGDLYIRVHTNGATLLDGTSFVVEQFTTGVPGILAASGHTFVAGDWVFVSGTAVPAINDRYFQVGAPVIAGFSFGLYDLLGNPIDMTLSCYASCAAETCGGTVTKVLEIPSPYLEADLPLIKFTQDKDVLSLSHPSYAFRELRRTGPTTWPLSIVSFAPAIATPTAPAVTPVIGTNGAPNPLTHFYRMTAVAPETLEESDVSTVVSASNDLGVQGNYNLITVGNSVPAAVRYNIYKLHNGVYAFIAQSDPNSFARDNNITPDAGKTAPIASTPISTVDNYPGAVGYFEQRRVFAGSNNRPQNFWLTASGTESNLNYSIPSQDSDAIYGKLNSKDAQRIRHVIPMSNLIFLTASGEWKVAPANADFLTPDSTFPKQDAHEGASHIKPVLAGGSVIYGHDASGRLRKMDYKWQSSAYFTDDLSILAPHLFDGFTLLDTAYQKAPVRIIWTVRSDGVLLGITYHPEHEVTAWHQHVTGPRDPDAPELNHDFETSACVKEGTEFPLYVGVKRIIAGVEQRTIERMRTRAFQTRNDAFFVDCGLTYDGSAATVIGGFWHLIGETVTILADGATHPDRVVDACGRITLQNEASKVHVGLRYTSDLQLLAAAWEGLEALAQSYMKNVSGVYLRVHQTVGMTAGPSLDRLRAFPPRSNEAWGEPPAVKSTMIEIPIEPDWNLLGQIFVRQSDPLPCTVLGLVQDISNEGAS